MGRLDCRIQLQFVRVWKVEDPFWWITSSWLCHRNIFFSRTGKYENDEDYLDRQVRVFREDYIKPLRDGLSKYRQNQKISDSKGCGVFVYKGVKIGTPFWTASDREVACSVRFLPPYWIDLRQRFIYGSLVLISSDRFNKEVIMATVCESHIDKKVTLRCRFL